MDSAEMLAWAQLCGRVKGAADANAYLVLTSAEVQTLLANMRLLASGARAD